MVSIGKAHSPKKPFYFGHLNQIPQAGENRKIKKEKMFG
jgi:hypothetical protein